jgi:hypothetical protein
LRDGQTTKVNILTDIVAPPAIVRLIPDNASDVKTTYSVLAAAPSNFRRAMVPTIRAAT